MKVVITAAARSDLEAIGHYIGRHDPERAEAFVDKLLDRCDRLTDAPEGFPLVPRYEARGVRRRPFRDYLIFCRVTGERIEVVHILHGAQDYERILSPDEQPIP